MAEESTAGAYWPARSAMDSSTRTYWPARSAMDSSTRTGTSALQLDENFAVVQRDRYHSDALLALGETLLALGRKRDAVVAFGRVLRFERGVRTHVLARGILLVQRTLVRRHARYFACHGVDGITAHGGGACPRQIRDRENYYGLATAGVVVLRSLRATPPAPERAVRPTPASMPATRSLMDDDLIVARASVEQILREDPAGAAAPDARDLLDALARFQRTLNIQTDD